MAVRATPLSRALPIGAAAIVAAALLLPLIWVIWRAEGFGLLRTTDISALWFTLWQAAVSAGLSLMLAIPVARALARRRFAGRSALVILLGAPFILPVLVAVLGLIALFGRSGILNVALETLGLPSFSIYGAQGVILAHVFFNMPLATRLILNGWALIPAEQHLIAASLGFRASDSLLHLEIPMLRRVLPGIFLVIFLICTTSFAVALALGGGPGATTVELAIYQAFRFDFDLPRAATLACVQMALGMGATIATLRITRVADFGVGLDRLPQRWDSDGLWLRYQDGTVLISAALFLLLPLFLVTMEGLTAITSLPASVWHAAVRSFIIALAAGVLTSAVALCLSFGIARARRPAPYEAISMLAISASPLVLGTGLYLMLLPWTNPVAWALPITLGVNVLLSLPFAVRALVPATHSLIADYHRLCASLGIAGVAWLYYVALPRLRGALGFSAGLAAALAAGDLGIVALFASPDQATLPLQMYQLMGAYRMEEAKAAAVILVALSLSLFWAFERGGRAWD